MQKISSLEIAKTLNFGGKVVDVEIDNISTDSRKVRPGDLFIAVKGENFDGHNFVQDVAEKGASLVVVNHQIEGVDPQIQIVVEDTLKAYGILYS